MQTFNLTDACSNESISYYEPGKFCPPIHDSILCWPATRANTTAYKLCRESKLFHYHHSLRDLPNEDDASTLDNLNLTAHRVCLPNGEWEPTTNYSECLAALAWTPTTEHAVNTDEEGARILSLIIFIGSVISLVVLLISLFIFLRFKSLQCNRTSIHKNLIVSFILRFVIQTIIVEPYVFNHHMWYTDMEWLCRAILSLQNLAYVANFCWMLVEGLFLHLILVLRPFNNEKAPFLLFYFIGWVVPLLVMLSWALVMHFKHDTHCWHGNTKLGYSLIIYVPIMLALFINLLILMNLIRIVIGKLCSGHTTELRKICRTIKSTVVLVFLLGIINLLFFFKPDEAAPDIINAYRYINAILPNCQGIFVSLLYCGMNAEVRRAIKKRWNRFKDARSMHSTGYRRRSSRTSMTMFVSNHPNCNGTEQPNLMEMQALKDTDANGHNRDLL